MLRETIILLKFDKYNNGKCRKKNVVEVRRKNQNYLFSKLLGD